MPLLIMKVAHGYTHMKSDPRIGTFEIDFGMLDTQSIKYLHVVSLAGIE